MPDLEDDECPDYLQNVYALIMHKVNPVLVCLCVVDDSMDGDING